MSWAGKQRDWKLVLRRKGERVAFDVIIRLDSTIARMEARCLPLLNLICKYWLAILAMCNRVGVGSLE